MLNDTEMLDYICQNAEMGRDGIMNIMNRTKDISLRQALEAQLTEYQQTYDSADQMLRNRGKHPTAVSPMAKMSSYVMSKMKTMSDSSPSQIAEMMIEGSTMGITKITKRMNEYDGNNSEILSLAEKQLKTEQANIEEMKKFL